MVAGIRGWDISNHQYSVDVADVVRRNGLDFTFVLSNDGTFKNVFFGAQVAAARSAGSLVAAYVYLRPNWQQTFDTMRSQVSTDVPVIVDVEEGSGDIATVWNFHRALWAAGYRTPLMYLPKFYWEKIGSPPLAGLPPLWKSWYPDNSARGYDAGLAMLPGYVWSAYGGLSVALVQFSGTGRLDGYGGNLDLNFYPGTRAELAAILGSTATGEDDDVDLDKDTIELWAGGDPVTLRNAIRSIQGLVADVHQVLTTPIRSASDTYDLAPRDLWRYVDFVQVKVDAIGKTLADAAGRDGTVTLSAEQVAQLRAQLDTSVDEMEANLSAQMNKMGAALSDTLGVDKDVVIEALRDFYRPVVVGSDPKQATATRLDIEGPQAIEGGQQA